MPSHQASCSCGQLSLVARAEPVRVSVCHCLACQHRTGSVFGVQARFAKEHVTIDGESSQYVRVGDEGGRATFHFCPVCGATVYWIADDNQTHLAVPVGAFADPGFSPPAVSVYEERMHAWVRMPDHIEHLR